MDRRAFIKKLAQYGWMAPVITTVLAENCNAGLSGYEPRQQVLDHKPLWEYLIKGGKRHDRK